MWVAVLVLVLVPVLPSEAGDLMERGYMGERRVCCSVACEPSESYSSSEWRCRPGVCGGGEVGCMACRTAAVAGGIGIEAAFAEAADVHVFAVMASMTLREMSYKHALFVFVGHNIVFVSMSQ